MLIKIFIVYQALFYEKAKNRSTFYILDKPLYKIENLINKLEKS